MTQPESLIAFKRSTHVFYTAYILSGYGMSEWAINLENREEYNPDGLFQIGRGRDDDRNRIAISEMRNGDVVNGLRAFGGFSQIIALGFITWTYSLWEGTYRAKIASEIGANVNDVMCDVMGDIRTIRNWIAHNNAIADDASKIKTLPYPIEKGPMVFTIDRIHELQDFINKMEIHIQQEPA